MNPPPLRPPDPSKNAKHFRYEVLLGPRRIPVDSLIDSCAEGGNYISPDLADTLNELGGVVITILDSPKRIEDFHGGYAPPIERILRTQLIVGRHSQRFCDFYITDLGHNDLIIGIQWLEDHGCVLNPVDRQLWFLGGHCQHEGAPIRIPLLDPEAFQRNVSFDNTTSYKQGERETEYSDSDSCIGNTTDSESSTEFEPESATSEDDVVQTITNYRAPTVEDSNDDSDFPRHGNRFKNLSPHSPVFMLDPKRRRKQPASVLNAKKRQHKQKTKEKSEQDGSQPLRKETYMYGLKSIYMIGEFAVKALHKRGYRI